ncbi:uncharacterized protein A4U43_C07F15750 [Asparagus officinalis]|uniref:Uncharacterized protein n=1 Tax=Asparagus officinalis TaxID=4686 RepID=A0A5P1EC93_ASPOF|nr:uncharacterized protein A4U43_C07F15750 [Asparagus officinalis]
MIEGTRQQVCDTNAIFIVKGFLLVPDVVDGAMKPSSQAPTIQVKSPLYLSICCCDGKGVRLNSGLISLCQMLLLWVPVVSVAEKTGLGGFGKYGLSFHSLRGLRLKL